MKKIVIAVMLSIIPLTTIAKEHEKFPILDNLAGVNIGLNGGATSGIGGYLGYRPFYKYENKILNTLALRIDFNYLHSLNIPQDAINDIIHKKTDTSLDFSQGDAHFSHNSFGFAVDVYPFERIFRATVGLYHNHSVMKGVIELGGLVTIGDHTYPFPPGYTMHGTVNFSQNWAPYFGIGFDVNVWKSLYVTTDLGLLVNSYPDVSLSLYGPDAFYVAPEDMRKEEDWIASKVAKLWAIPILKIGLAYKF